MPCQFEVTRRVEFSETDMAGIMHFSNYFRFMETAESGFFRSIGLSVVLSRSGLAVGLPRVHAECDYQVPLRFEDEVLVRLLVEKKSARSLSYQFRFYRLNGSARQLVARGRVTAVCTARQPDGSLKAVALPQAVADQIQVAPAELLAQDSRGPERPASVSPARASHPQAPATLRPKHQPAVRRTRPTNRLPL